MVLQGIDKRNAEVKAVSNCIAILEETPATLAEFIIALDKGKHKEWLLFKKEYNKAISNYIRGRSIPIKKGIGGTRPLGFGQIHGLTKNGPKRVPTINFSKCKTKVDKVKLILKQDISQEIKQDLIEFVLGIKQ